MRETVLKFIKQFQNQGTVETFTEGCCYWFAVILKKRFAAFHPTMMYNPIDNHFATKIGNTLYDITGVIKPDEFESWTKYSKEDYLLTRRIIKDCILKV